MTKEQLKHLVFNAESKEQIGGDIDKIIVDLISQTSNFSHVRTIVQQGADYVEEIKQDLLLKQKIDKNIVEQVVSPILMAEFEEYYRLKKIWARGELRLYPKKIDFLLFAEHYLKNRILNLENDFKEVEIQREESEEIKGLKDEVANLRKDIATKYDFNKQVFKRKEAIAYLGVSERQFTTLVSTKKLIKPVSRASKTYTFLKVELDKYLESSTNK